VGHAVRGLEASPPVVLIDGRSGAGKTTLAGMIVEAWPPPARVQLVALDALYPGWDGLQAGVEIARDRILVPHSQGRVGTWRAWDWDAGEPAAEHVVDPARPLIVEGSGLLDARTAPLGDVRVWLESPPASRRRRALARDGDAYRPHWDRWAAQEESHVLQDAPRSHATHVFEIP
jgi:uridine kinase